jgi:hypothetical protein
MQRVHSRRSPGNPLPTDQPAEHAFLPRDFSQMSGASRGSRPTGKRERVLCFVLFSPPLQDFSPFPHLTRPKSIETLSWMHPPSRYKYDTLCQETRLFFTVYFIFLLTSKFSVSFENITAMVLYSQILYLHSL